MQVVLASLEGGTGEFTHQYRPDELEFADERVVILEPPRVQGRVARDGSTFKISGRMSARVKVECDRCLQDVELPVDSEFNLEYVTADQYAQLNAAELSEEDLQLSIYDGEVFDIDEIVREQLLLAIPYQAVCQETCRGFCPSCGTNLNFNKCDCREVEIDPRWAALKDLQ